MTTQDDLAPARGIITGLLLSIPLWFFGAFLGSGLFIWLMRTAGKLAAVMSGAMQ